VGNPAAKSHYFDARNYGPKLGDLVHKPEFLEVKAIPSPDGSPIVHIHVRLKSAR